MISFIIDRPEVVIARKECNFKLKPHERRRGMPSVKSIRERWAETSIWILKGYDSKYEFLGCPEWVCDKRTGETKLKEDNYCMACGTHFDFKLERCHIVPLSQGGSNEWWNIHLLCGACHSDSEFLGDPELDPDQNRYWSWFFPRNMLDMMLSQASRSGMNLSQLLRSKSCEEFV